MSRIAILRLAAVVLLLLMGVEFAVCDVVGVGQCESFGTPGVPSGPQDDNCICCCTHIVVTQPVVLLPLAEQVMMTAALDPAEPNYDRPSIYHPPRA